MIFDISMHRCQLFCHNQGIYLNEKYNISRIETSPLICSANQWTGFCIIGTSVMKDSRRCSSTYIESLLLHVVPIWLFFHEYLRFTGQQVKRRLSPYILSTTSTRSTDTWHYLGYCCREPTSTYSWKPDSNKEPLLHALYNPFFLYLHW